MAQLGYDDTPYLPGSKWRVHDGTRPQPRIITPGTASTPEQAGATPSDAVVLFGGKDLSGWQSVKDKGPAKWKIEQGFAEVVPGTGDIESREHFGDCQLHLEFACPSLVKGDSQGRGNSGVFLLGRYEIQVLDGYQNPTYADGITASIYGQYPPWSTPAAPRASGRATTRSSSPRASRGASWSARPSSPSSTTASWSTTGRKPWGPPATATSPTTTTPTPPPARSSCKTTATWCATATSGTAP